MHLLADLRLASRSLRRTPGLTAVIVLTLACGIGVNTAIFSFYSAILLEDPPFHDPARLVVFKAHAHDFGEPAGGEVGLLAADFRDLRSQARSFESLATYTLDAATLTGSGAPRLTTAAIVTPNFFTTLGGSPALGRVFSERDEGSGQGRLVVLGHAFWQSHFGGDPTILGRTVTLNRIPFVVVGVMPAGFEFPREADLWVTPRGDVPENAIGADGPDFGGRGNFVRTVLGRLRPGVQPAAAGQEVAALTAQLPNPTHHRREMHPVTMRDQAVGGIRTTMTLLQAGVALVLLLACLNVANLLLSRAVTRRREIAIRLALGGGRWGIARQWLTESLLLAACGGAAGLLVGAWGVEVLTRIAPDSVPRLDTVGLDAGVLVFTAVATLLTGVSCGLAPILAILRGDPPAMTRDAGERGGSAGPRERRLRFVLVAGEVAVACVLLVAASLLWRSLERIRSESWGFDPAHVVTARVIFGNEDYRTREAQRRFQHDVIRRLQAVPGFDSVGTSLDRIGQSWVHLHYTLEDTAHAAEGESPQAAFHFVNGDYFRTLGIPLLQGRTFAESDDAEAERVAIIDATLAERHFPGGNAVGRRLGLPSEDGTHWATIIGLVAAVKTNGPGGPHRPDVYVSFRQVTADNFHVHVRTRLPIASVGAAIASVVHQIDPGIPVADLASMEQVIARTSADRHFPLGLLGAFACVALVLAALGIFAVASYDAAQRTREIGIRMALGANAGGIIRLLLRQGFGAIATGLVVGLAGALATALAMRGLLFGIAPIDLATFLAVPTLMVLVAGLAIWLPARRATRLSPSAALQRS